MSKETAPLSRDIFKPATLDEIAVGDCCVITECNLPATVGVRLAEMGLTRGAIVTVLKVAPLGDPIEVRVRGYSLCLRKEILRGFAVSPTKRK